MRKCDGGGRAAAEKVVRFPQSQRERERDLRKGQLLQQNYLERRRLSLRDHPLIVLE